MVMPAAMRLMLLAVCVALAGCVATPPSNTVNACAIFAEKPGWWDAVKDSERRWGVPPHIQLAIINQESAFSATARPERRKILLVLPGPRRSSAFGYTQAVDATWDEYKADTGRRGADRDSFRAAADFVGWYGRQSKRRSGIALDDAYNQYLAYHEGHRGYNRGVHERDAGLKRTAQRVAAQADRYERQIESCRRDLHRFWFAFS